MALTLTAILLVPTLASCGKGEITETTVTDTSAAETVSPDITLTAAFITENSAAKAKIVRFVRAFFVFGS